MGDIKRLDYEDVEEYIRKAPMTYVPSLFLTACKACVEKGCFNPGKMWELAKRIEEDEEFRNKIK